MTAVSACIEDPIGPAMSLGAEDKAPSLPAPEKRGKRLMLLAVPDDDERGKLQGLLEKIGAVVVVASSARHAIERLRQLNIFLAIVKDDLNGYDGMGLLRLMARAKPTCRLVLLSGRRPVDTAGLAAIGAFQIQRKTEARLLLREICEIASRPMPPLASMPPRLIREPARVSQTRMPFALPRANQLNPYFLTAESVPSKALVSKLWSIRHFRGLVVLTGETGVEFEQAACELNRFSDGGRGLPVFFNRNDFEGKIIPEPGVDSHGRPAFHYIHEASEFGSEERGRVNAFVEKILAPESRGGRLVVACSLPSGVDCKEARRWLVDLASRAGTVITIPPLRERQADIPVIAQKLFHNLTVLHPFVAVRSIDPEAIRLLAAHSWPGNFSQLVTVLRGAIAIGTTRRLAVEHITRFMGNDTTSLHVLESAADEILLQ